ncbi:carbohydrate ABC transporter permease [Paenibacillus nasutitermitis]|uniref:Lactose ABC transporter permease n=1 Tax=Paenibacillus nasutitermitis TaxID=1652958 RepID=A0A916YXN2_9BACL|nr:sugar ABC transporter permease [Paenibacillus nasutitermitis]GGD66230.1 lactose ABC transporter permease [Paenibacillus nasutitermitis]
MKKRIVSGKTLRNLEGSLFMLPWLLGFLAFLAFPLLFSLYMSFHNVKVLPKQMKYDYVGLQYFKSILFESSALYDIIIPFFQEAIIMIPVIIVFSLLMAILLNQKLRGRMLFRAIFFLPVIFSTGYVLTEFVNQGEGSLGFLERYELANYLDTFLGDSSWTTPIKQVLNRFVLVLWFSGVQIIIFLGGRQTISASAYESARIDGASPWEVFWKITLPAMAPFILLNLIYTVVDLFTYPFNPIMDLIGSGQGAYGYNSALVWIYFMIIIVFLSIVVLFYIKLSRNRTGARR